MAFIVLALGALLSIGGALSILYGYGIVEIERGWTAVIAGTTALTGGILTMALGIVIMSLRSLRAALAPLPVRSPTPIEQDTPYDSALHDSPLYETPSNDPRFQEARFQEARFQEARFHEEPGHDLLLPGLVGGPATAPLVTPELENSMLAAMLATRHEEPSHETAAFAEAGATDVATERSDVRPPHINALLETQQRDTIIEPAPIPAQPEEVSRFKVSFRRPPVVPLPVEASPPEPSLSEPSLPEPSPSEASLREPSPREPVPAAAEERDAPAMDDWLDRAFSALDNERPQTAIRPKSPEPDESLKIGAPQVEHAMAEAEPAAVAFEAPPPAPHQPAPTSAVIGRYEADGISYVMYADGSIEAHSDTGVERFNSMAELKAYIESTG